MGHHAHVETFVDGTATILVEVQPNRDDDEADYRGSGSIVSRTFAVTVKDQEGEYVLTCYITADDIDWHNLDE